MGIRKSILPIGLAVMLVSVMITAPIVGSTPFVFAQINIDTGVNVLSIDAGGKTLKDGDPILRKINPNTGATISSVAITLDGSFTQGEFVNGATGVEFNPADGKIYALLKISIDPGADGGQFEDQSRHLATIDPQTGVATLVGDTGLFKIATLTFNPGTLFTVNLDDFTLSTISTGNGAVTNLCVLDVINTGADGSSLAFNPDDGHIYYATELILQRINIFNVGDPANSCVVASMAIDPIKPTALVFFNSFLIAHFLDPNDDTVFLSSITDLGADTDKGAMDHFSRGLTVIDNRVVGGTFIPIDTTALLLAGIQTNALWIMSTLAIIGIVAFGAVYITVKKN